MMLGVILVPKTPEHDQFLDPKFIGQDLYGEMACAKFSGIVSQASERPKTFRLFRGSVCYQCNP